ncbi:MAG: hypothetical protein QF907_02300 [Nitrospinota bacterium]|jgi:septal ring factor EnvC (AmiA/AmiB activator)|nr:hypothetical protein [Nitrospinota bacterium]MDP7349804.1 hypothetical protein [Nitrospinota bacterium]MDP7581503.1 hypothetical protein [Nitrospinota bacterium]HJN02835.1 hypothetical protein [Nitrospinota bacterium]|tara:strand:+ start:290 stop:559 length:270 start_codon:yes stop_codon:yes gene_type:complete
MANSKIIKELKKEVKKIEKMIHELKTKIQKIEKEGCLSDQELNEKDKKIGTINNEIIYLNKEKFFLSQSIVSIEGTKWIKKSSFNNRQI